MSGVVLPLPESVSVASPSHAEPSRYLAQALSRLRWATIAALLLLTILQPATGRSGLPTWALLLLFAGYNLLLKVVQRRFPASRSIVRDLLLDLPVAGLVYVLGAQPGGPLFVLFVLAVVCAAVSLTLHGTLLYTAAATATVVVIEPTLPLWSPGTGHIRELGARVVGLGVVAIGTTILARRLALEEEASRSSRGEAERLAELDRLRADFVASVSHDLQTPLAATRVSLGLLDASAAGRLQPEERELLDSARRNNQRLGLLIDDLLAYNQLEAGTLRLDRQPLDLRPIVADAMSTVHPLMEDKGQTLEVDFLGPLPVEGDARRLEQAVVNLLANAHQHTPPGTRVAIAGQTTASEILLSVRDDGPGIPVEELEPIFQRFHRLDATGKGHGSGLGLSIARELVELHGGRIWAESTPGEGCVFHVALPKAAGGGAP
ncbi:MAG: HAMP domain-containing histidine kinase [Chloroflexota bacterium]|nr:HAMP domain-containing histidine kinase [Chloroflexota bacterium]